MTDHRIIMHRQLISVVLLLFFGIFAMNTQSKQNDFSFTDEEVFWDKYFDANPNMHLFNYAYRENFLSFFFNEAEKKINSCTNLDEYFVVVEENIDNGIHNIYFVYFNNDKFVWQAEVWRSGTYGEILHKTLKIKFSMGCSPKKAFSFYTPYEDSILFDATAIFVKHVKNGVAYRHAFYGLDIGGKESELQQILDLCCTS